MIQCLYTNEREKRPFFWCTLHPQHLALTFVNKNSQSESVPQPPPCPSLWNWCQFCCLILGKGKTEIEGLKNETIMLMIGTKQYEG